MKRQRSLTEAVLISFGSTSGFPKTLKRWRANASQRQIICCTVSATFPQNLQVGSPSNRRVLTGVCPVRIATTILSGGLFSISGSSALFLHCPPIKSLPCLWPSKSLQALWCWFTVQVLIASLVEHLGIPRADSGPRSGMADARLTTLSVSSLQTMPQCSGTQTRVTTSFRPASAGRAFRHSASSSEVTFGPLSALTAAWLPEKIRIRWVSSGGLWTLPQSAPRPPRAPQVH
jgi:hypothetical protein